MSKQVDCGRVQLLCFDLDGTLIDSEPLHQRAKEQLVAELGYDKEIDYESFVGKPNHVFWEPVLTGLPGNSETAQSMERRQYDRILDMAKTEGYRPSDGLSELLAYGAEQGIAMVVCSSSNRYYVEKMVRLLDLDRWFVHLIGGDEVPRKKPAPDIYEKALSLCGVGAGAALAIEDSAAGVAAAAGAGIPCIGYQNPTSGGQDLSGAVLRVAHFGEILSYIKEGAHTGGHS